MYQHVLELYLYHPNFHFLNFISNQLRFSVCVCVCVCVCVRERERERERETCSIRTQTWIHMGFRCDAAGKESACNEGDLGLIPGLGRSPGEGKGCPSFQYSGLNISKDCTVHGVSKSPHGGSEGKASAHNVGDPGSIPGSERSPGEEKATHSHILAWKIPWTEEPGRLQTTGLERVGHD